MPNFGRALCSVVASMVLLAVALPIAQARGGPGTRIDRPESCNEMLPESVQVSSTGANVALEVLVLLDEVPRADAQTIFTVAAEAYAPLKITLVPTFKKATFDPSVSRAEELIEAARVASGGVRPTGTDVVYVLTSRDIFIGSGDVVGHADCIGGIRYPNRAFAVGEAAETPENTGGINFYLDGPAKVAAHEIGHLLGGRHEQANCAQGLSAQDATRREATPCTVMSAYLDFQSNNFGSLDGAVVRSYAERYAAP